LTANIIVYGTNWCYGCRRAKVLLEKHNFSYQFIDIDRDSNAREFVERTNRGFRSVPTILFPDGSHLVEPNDQEFVRKLTSLRFEPAASG
jgi:glutaredoxin